MNSRSGMNFKQGFKMRKYEVKWYELNLTTPMSRKFFTRLGATIFASYLEVYEYAKPKITEIDK